MLRPFLSLVVAGVGTVVGLSVTWLGATSYTRAFASFDVDPGAAVVAVTGVLIASITGLSLAIHWVGVLVIGGIHSLLGLLALVVPFGNPFAGGIFSPVFQMTRMLSSVDPALGDGATVFYFSGTALIIGTFLLGAALGVRSRRLAGPSSAKAVAVSASLGAATLIAACALLIVAGGAFVRLILLLMKYDAALAALTVVGSVFAGFAGLFLRWSSIGVIAVSALLVVVGAWLFVDPAVFPAFPGTLTAAYGLLMVAGATFLAAALGGMVRGTDEVPERIDAL